MVDNSIITELSLQFIKMFNRHILALKMNYKVFTRFGKLHKPNWDWVYKIIKNSKTCKSYINFNQSY